MRLYLYGSLIIIVFVLAQEPFYSAQNTADFIDNNLPKDAGIMTQPGYTIKLIYQTDNRIVSIYPKPDSLLDLIDYYDISYIVFSRYYTWDRYHFSKDSVEFVRNNPNKFEHVATIQEDYSDFFVEGDPTRTDEVYVYRVKDEK